MAGISTTRKMKTKRTPNEIGDDLEERAKLTLSGKRVTQSGGGKFWKCDMKDGGLFIWSCKATEKDRIVITPDMFREVMAAARGSRGTGDGFKAGIIAECAGFAVAITMLDDFAEIAQAEGSGYVPQTQAQERRARATRSLLG